MFNSGTKLVLVQPLQLPITIVERIMASPVVSFSTRRCLFLNLIVNFALFLIQTNGTGAKPTEQTASPDSSYYLSIYNFLNSYRARHVSPSLKWSTKLNRQAEDLAVLLAQGIADDPDQMDGTIYWGKIGGLPKSGLVVSTWYNESLHYDYLHPGKDLDTYNFSQMVWKSSTSVGIGGATYRRFTVVVAKFSPSGNIPGKFEQNVKYPRVPVQIILDI